MTTTALRRESDDGTVTTLVLPTSTTSAIAAAIAERDQGWAAAEEADRAGWDKRLIDQAIDALADTGRPFSANDLRELLPDTVRGALYGSRFYLARRQDRIRFVGYVTSTKKNTHCKPVGQYVRA